MNFARVCNYIHTSLTVWLISLFPSDPTLHEGWDHVWLWSLASPWGPYWTWSRGSVNICWGNAGYFWNVVGRNPKDNSQVGYYNSRRNPSELNLFIHSVSSKRKSLLEGFYQDKMVLSHFLLAYLSFSGSLIRKQNVLEFRQKAISKTYLLWNIQILTSLN